MIQLIKNKSVQTYQSANEYLQSNEQLKRKIKVTVIATAVITALIIGIDNYRNEAFVRDITQVRVHLIRIPGIIFKNISKDGISFLWPPNFFRVISGCRVFCIFPMSSTFCGCFVYNYTKRPLSISRLITKILWMLDRYPKLL